MAIRSGQLNVIPRSTKPSKQYRSKLFFAALLAVSVPDLQAQLPPPPEARDQIDDYMLAIENMEANRGPYAGELIDLYHGYGQALMNSGDPEAALDAFQQTAMISRVNHGPHSLEQANYLYSVAKAESLLGRLEPSIDVLEYIYELYAREYGENSPEMLPVIDELYRWYNEEKPLQALRSRSSDFQNTSFLVSRKAALTAAQYGIGTPQAAEGFREQGQLHFRTILYMFRTGDPPLPNLVFNGGESNNPWVVERSISNHFRAGERAFERVIESWQQNPGATTLDVAEAIAQLGDWYLVLEQFRAAGREYERAYNLLAGGGENQVLADEYFGAPAPLKFLRPADSFNREPDPPAFENSLEIIMNVSRNGRLSDIEFRNIPANESPEDIEAVRKRLEYTRFRPAVVMGETAEIERFAWKPPPAGPKMASNDNSVPDIKPRPEPTDSVD